MFKSLVMLGAGWFIYTKSGRKTAKNICINCIPMLEKELGTDSEFGKQLKSNPELARIYNTKREALGLASLQQQMISLLETHDVQEIIEALKMMEKKDV